MTTRHPLGTEGSWVELRDFTDLRYGDKQAVQAAITETERPMAGANEMSNALAALLVVSWGITPQLPIPSQDISVIAMLSLADGNALEKLIEPARALLFPGDPEPATVEEHAAAVADPASPTMPSVDS